MGEEVKQARKNNLPLPGRFRELETPATPASGVPADDQSKFTSGGKQAPLSTAAQLRQAELLRRRAAERR